jgi:quinoprotein dehydrogenase-associated SoxYZ-like carrier
MLHRLSAYASIILISLTLAPIAEAADGPPDPSQVGIWLLVRNSLFGNRAIADDAGEVVSLRAPARAQDASTVPIAISTRMEQTPERYVSKVYLIIDQNPSPVAAIFTFTPDSGRADIETRVRVEDYTWMRAVAETNDGRLFLAARYVKAAGGCSAPYGTAPDFDAFKPRLKLRLDASIAAGEPTLAQLMIQHPRRVHYRAGFDEGFFLYEEDADLCRRLGAHAVINRRDYNLTGSDGIVDNLGEPPPLETRWNDEAIIRALYELHDLAGYRRKPRRQGIRPGYTPPENSQN